MLKKAEEGEKEHETMKNPIYLNSTIKNLITLSESQKQKLEKMLIYWDK